MKQFISIVLRNQFNLFYRFGYTYIPSIYLIEFDGNISDDVKNKVAELFFQITPFEYDEEYLILHFEKEMKENNTLFNIKDLIAVYPLSQQAKVSIESKIDQRIRLENPLFEKVLPKIEAEIEKKEVEKAIDALWTICKIEGDSEKYIRDIGIENILKGLEHRKNGIKANNIQNGDYWEYLIAYDRYDYFPNTTLGYFYDAGQVFAYSKGQPTFEGSKLHTLLQNLLEKDIKLFAIIIEHLEQDEQAKGYISQTSEIIKQYEITPIYFMLRDAIRNADDLSSTKIIKNLDYLLKFGDSFKYAIILLGAFFGFRKFYDAYYDCLNLRFYKNYKKPIKTQNDENEKSSQDIDNELKIEENTQNEKDTKDDTVVQNQENQKTDVANEIHRYVAEQLKIKPEISLTEIKEKFKLKTNSDVKNAIQNMEGIEIFKSGKEKLKKSSPTFL